LNKTLRNLIRFAASLPGEKGDCLEPKHYADDRNGERSDAAPWKQARNRHAMSILSPCSRIRTLSEPRLLHGFRSSGADEGNVLKETGGDRFRFPWSSRADYLPTGIDKGSREAGALIGNTPQRLQISASPALKFQAQQ
jgi:hypothetical protein